MILFLMIMTLCITTVSALEDGIIESAAEIEYPPFSIENEDGDADGFAVELLEAALNAKGLEVTFYTGPWAEVKEDLADGKIQVLPLVGRTPEREPIYDFTEPYLTFFGTIFVREGNTDIITIEDLKDKEVLVLKGDNAEEYALRAEVSEDLISVKTYDEAFQLLSTGKHDAIIAHNLVGKQIIKELNIENVVSLDYRIDEFRQDFTFAVKEGDTKLLAVLDEGLAIILEDGTFDMIKKKWFVTEPEEEPVNYLFMMEMAGLVLIVIFLIVGIRWHVNKKRNS